MSGPSCMLESFAGKFSLSLSFLFFFSLSLAIPQFGLQSHVSSLRLSSGHSGQVLTLSTDYAAHTSLSSPHWLVVDVSICATSPLAVVVRHVFWGFFFFFFSSYSVDLWDSNTPHRPAYARVSYCVETSPPSQLPPQDGSPSLTLLSLFVSFIFCPTSFQREWSAFLSSWCPLLVFRSFFVEVFAHSNHLLMNLLGRKWSPCPISLPSWDHLLQKPVSFIRLKFYYFPSQTIIFSLQL